LTKIEIEKEIDEVLQPSISYLLGVN